jgi:hypothetical protein
METILAQLSSFGVAAPEISLPARSVQLDKWPVVACDQWTQDKAYWERVDNMVGSAPSTLRLILPEAYLGEKGEDTRISMIHETMRSYLSGEYTGSAILAPARRAGVFVERETEHGIRRGFMMTIDLEKYDWRPGSSSVIRATEGIIEQRLPARMKIRRNAPLECPHILLLIDDSENVLVTLFQKLLQGAPTAYETPLMFGAGRVRGQLVYRKNDWAFINDSFQYLYRRAQTRFGEAGAFLFAVGDGNHSLAAAKAVWEEFKQDHGGEAGLEHHRARYALVEVVNLYDSALRFEPIHRIILGITPKTALKILRESGRFSELGAAHFDETARRVNEDISGKNRYGFVSKDECMILEAEGGKAATVELEPLLELVVREAQANGEKAVLDYIHGTAELKRLVTSRPDSAGVLLPPFRREGLFKTIAESGPLPRKSFSMGAAAEKRFYLECRKLFW